MNTAKTCIECPKPIHPERLAIRPQVKTCSAACSINRKNRHRSEASTRCHRRQHAKAKAHRPVETPIDLRNPSTCETPIDLESPSTWRAHRPGEPIDLLKVFCYPQVD